MEVVVGRLGRPQGLRGEVTVEVRTDEPDVRFAIGATLLTRRPDLSGPPLGSLPSSLTVSASRLQSGRLVLSFDGVADRTAAESLRDLLLVVEVDPEERPAEPDEFYDHQLVGLDVRAPDGGSLGAVADVLHLPSQDVLVVRSLTGGEVLVPFVSAIVTAIDLVGRTVAVDPPPGLFDTADPS